MKKNLWKALMILTLCVVLLAPVAAVAARPAAARYPTLTGVVTDDANALSQSVITDTATYAEDLEDETDVKLHVALVHFLDGVDVQTYADTLFTRWNLGDNDFLLVGAIGEDSFASVAGADVKRHISDSNAQNLLFSSGFSELFRSQQYDAAFSKYLIAFNKLVAKQYGETISMDQLFTAYQTSTGTSTSNAGQSLWQTAAEMGSTVWNNAMGSITQNVDSYNSYREHTEGQNGRGLSPTGWIVLVVIILIIFGQSNPARKARKAYRGGCGCSPLGWIVGGLGLGAWLNNLQSRGHRH